MPICIVREGRTLLEWAVELLSKTFDWVTGDGWIVSIKYPFRF